MKRRDVFKASLAVPALALVRGAGAAGFPKSPGLTRSIASSSSIPGMPTFPPR